MSDDIEEDFQVILENIPEENKDSEFEAYTDIYSDTDDDTDIRN